jgi:nicotinate phosphoribosyltransferase
MRARSLATVTDFYEFTMAECYHRHLPDTWATFDLFVRQLPEHRSFLIAAGVEDILDFLEDFRFTRDDIGYLRGLGVFSKDFVSYLKRHAFYGDVWAMPEGTVFFPNEPL